MIVPSTLQTRFAWWVILLLFLGSVTNYIDRAALAVIAPQVRRSLLLSNTDYGIALNAFLILYMTGYVWGGRLADRFGCRRVFAWALFLWSAASAAHCVISGLVGLCLCRALLGLGEGAFYPAAIRGATEWLPPESRGKAVGLYLAGISIGTLLTPPMAATLASQYGWRAAFLLTSVFGFLLLPLWLLLHRRIRKQWGDADPTPGQRRQQEENASCSSTISLTQVLHTRKYWLLLSSRALSDMAWYFYLFWIPAYFQEVRGFNSKMVAEFLWIPFFSAGLGSLIGAWTSSRLIQQGMSSDKARKKVMFVSALVAIAGTLAFLASSFQALAMVSVGLFAYEAWASNLHATIIEVSPLRHTSVLYGITGASGALAGAVSQPLIGRIVDFQGYHTVFVIVGFLHLVALVCLLRAGKIEPIRGTEASLAVAG